jgi:hypothetical protein
MDQFCNSGLQFISKNSQISRRAIQRVGKRIATKSTRNAIRSIIKLPDLNLPTFSGNYSTELASTTPFKHVRTDLNNCQKLHYLKSCLKGDALSTVEALSTVRYDLCTIFGGTLSAASRTRRKG